MFGDRRIPNFSRLSSLFQKQLKDFLSLLKFKDFFEADLEFKATAGTLR